MAGLSDEVLKEYYKKIKKLCLFWLKDKEEAEDISQDIFVKVLEKMDDFRDQSGIYTWIYRISVNTLNNYVRRKKIVEFLSFDSDKRVPMETFGTATDDPAFNVELEMEKTEQLKQLEAALGKLSSREKSAFYFYHYEGLKQKDVAEIMGTSVSAVESMIFKGMKKIKKFLA